MKIGLLINKIDTNGGIQKNYQLLYKRFKSHGHDVYLFVLHKPTLIKVEDENILYLEGKHLYQKGKSLKKYINKIGHFDLFLVNATKLKKYLHGIPYYVTVHNTWSKKINHRNPFKKWAKYKDLKNAFYDENIIGISEGVVDDVKNVLNIQTKSSKTIYAPHDMQTVRRLAQANIEVQGDYIIAVGGLQKRKRFNILINAFSNVLNNFPDIKLIIIGNGSEKKNLESYIESKRLKENVLLLGFKENPYPYIKNAKLLVSSSYEEGLPRVLVEALILNTPVVSTKSSTSIDEIMTHDLKKFVCKIDNHLDIQTKIENALDSYPKIESHYYEKFDISYTYKQYLSLIEHVNDKS